MAEQEHVIEEQMHETRKDLADKLQKLEQKIAGTVETVTDTVSAVTETVETVKDKVENTVESVTEGVGNAVETVKETVREFFDVPGHVRHHPWLMLGGSVAVGYLAGRLLLPRQAKDRRLEPMTTPSAASHGEPPPAPRYARSEEYRPEGRYFEESGHASHDGASRGQGFLSRLTEQFGGQLGHIKGVALGTLFGAVRDMVAQYVPEAIRKDVTEMINGMTTNLGGQVVQGQSQDGSGQSSRQPGEGTYPH